MSTGCAKREFAPDQSEQRRLARAVAPHEAHLVARRDRRRGVLEERAALDRIGDVLDAQDGRRLAPARAGCQRGIADMLRPADRYKQVVSPKRFSESRRRDADRAFYLTPFGIADAVERKSAVNDGNPDD